MSKTPETNALLKQCKIKGKNPDPWKLCRKLERERNNLQDQRDFAMSEMERLKRERDEARNESLEQARLLAMSGDREMKLLAQLDQAQKTQNPDT